MFTSVKESSNNANEHKFKIILKRFFLIGTAETVSWISTISPTLKLAGSIEETLK
jgi:hypothetical protein